MAGKLRGDLLWLFSATSGYGARYAAPLLAEQQANESPLDATAVATLRALLAMVQSAPPREFFVHPVSKPVDRVYTDASFEDSQLRLGWIVFPADASRPFGGTCLVPPEVLLSWKPRVQQIFPGETLAPLVVLLLHPGRFLW